MLIHGEIKLLALPGQEVQSEVKHKLKLDEQNIKISPISAPPHMLNSPSFQLQSQVKHALKLNEQDLKL